MPDWLQTIIDIVTRLFGGETSADRALTDRRLGQIQQQLADAKETAKEAEDAKQITQDVRGESDAALDAELRGDDPGRQ